MQTDETVRKGGDTSAALTLAPELPSAFVTAAAQGVDNQMTFLPQLAAWSPRQTHSTAGTKS
jgi:hypothetical protein